jgi:hypothetical protein
VYGARTTEGRARTFARGREWPRGGGAHVLGGNMRPSASRMRPIVCRMRPLRRRMCPSDMRMCPSANVCTPQPAVYAWSNPDHPTWQRCGSHRGQSKSRFTMSKVNKMLTLIGRTRTLSDMTDGQTHRQPCLCTYPSKLCLVKQEALNYNKADSKSRKAVEAEADSSAPQTLTATMDFKAM